jgi:hypothetical protein
MARIQYSRENLGKRTFPHLGHSQCQRSYQSQLLVGPEDEDVTIPSVFAFPRLDLSRDDEQ